MSGQVDTLVRAEKLLQDVQEGKEGAVRDLLGTAYSLLVWETSRWVRQIAPELGLEPGDVLHDIYPNLQKAVAKKRPNGMNDLVRMTRRRVINRLKKLAANRTRKPWHTGAADVNVAAVCDVGYGFDSVVSERELCSQIGRLPHPLNAVASAYYLEGRNAKEIGLIVKRSGRRVQDYIAEASRRIPLIRDHEKDQKQIRAFYHNLHLRRLRAWLEETMCPPDVLEWYLGQAQFDVAGSRTGYCYPR